jgi:nucleoside 2-deoxyribosyltransferase
MSLAKIYLSGPITGLSYDEATGWRDYCLGSMVAVDFLCPLRGKEYLREESNLRFDYSDHCMSTSRAIVERDFNDVVRSDALIVNVLNMPTLSIGTVAEVCWAFALRKPIVLVAKDDSVFRKHPMLKEACAYQVETLDEALEIVSALYG